MYNEYMAPRINPSKTKPVPAAKKTVAPTPTPSYRKLSDSMAESYPKFSTEEASAWITRYQMVLVAQQLFSDKLFVKSLQKLRTTMDNALMQNSTAALQRIGTDVDVWVKSMCDNLDAEKTFKNSRVTFKELRGYTIQKNLKNELDAIITRANNLSVSVNSKQQSVLKQWGSIVRNTSFAATMAKFELPLKKSLELTNEYNNKYSSSMGLTQLMEKREHFVKTPAPSINAGDDKSPSSKTKAKVSATHVVVQASLDPMCLSSHPELENLYRKMQTTKLAGDVQKLMELAMTPVRVDMSKPQAVVTAVNKKFDTLVQGLQDLKLRMDKDAEALRLEKEKKQIASLRSALAPHLALLKSNPALLKSVLDDSGPGM